MRLAVFLMDRLPRTVPVLRTTLLFWYLCVRTYVRHYQFSSLMAISLILTFILSYPKMHVSFVNYIICSKVIVFFSLDPKYTIQNPLRNKKVCTKIIHVIMENILPYRSDSKSMLCNVAIKVSPLSSQMFIRDFPLCFVLT